jgi:antitoxin component YwqK of YwqJK toxin-antitoxin module
MKTILINIIIVSLVITNLTSCINNDDKPNNDNQDTSGLIKNIKFNNNPVLDYFYNANAKIKERNLYDGNDQLNIKYEYQNNKISTEKAFYNGTVVYQYNYSYSNGKLDIFDIVGAAQSYYQMHYDNDDHIDYAIEYISGAPAIKHEFIYANNNVIEASIYNRFGNIWELQSKLEFEYDTKKNPIYDLGLPFSETLDEYANFVSPNNAIRVKEYDNANVLIKDTPYQITYNASNYPIEVIVGNGAYNFTYY